MTPPKRTTYTSERDAEHRVDALKAVGIWPGIGRTRENPPRYWLTYDPGDLVVLDSKGYQKA